MIPFRLLLITDEASCRRRARGVVQTVLRALFPNAEGAAVLVRMKDRSREEVARTCEALLPITRRAGAHLLAHTYADLVDELGLDGAHLSSSDPVPLRHRGVLGASRHNPTALTDETLASVDFVTLSPIFPPYSKPADARGTLGTQVFEKLRDKPVLALGGINAERARACVRAGAAGVAVIDAVMSAHDPRRATLDLLEATRT